jgi:hypothetical protein
VRVSEIPVTCAVLLSAGISFLLFAHLLFASQPRRGLGQPPLGMQPRATGTRIVAALSPYAGVHSHLNPADAAGAIEAAPTHERSGNCEDHLHASPFTRDEGRSIRRSRTPKIEHESQTRKRGLRGLQVAFNRAVVMRASSA